MTKRVGSPRRPAGSPMSGAAKGMTLAFDFAGAVALFWLIGRALDGWLGTEPWAQVVGAVLGWVGGVLHVYYASMPQDIHKKAAAKGPRRAA